MRAISVIVVAFALRCALSKTVVFTRNGYIRGQVHRTTTGKVYAYLGIPYATPPIGHLRFQKPQPAPQWNTTYEANTLPKSCPQPSVYLNELHKVNSADTSEDCLYMNIWVPMCETPLRRCINRPVVVYLHGGAFIYGGADWKLFDASELASRGNVITVVLNYRLGALGFLYLGNDDAPGNMGLHDQVMAISWIRNNIKEFGGDPKKITLMGESAGALAVGFHIASPLTNSYFRRAIMQSASPYSSSLITTKEKAFKLSETLAAYTNCSVFDSSYELMVNETIQCLRTVNAHDIVEATEKFNSRGADSFFPILGDDFMPYESIDEAYTNLLNVADVDLLASITSDEGSYFLHHFLGPFVNLNSSNGITHDSVDFYLRVLLRSLLKKDGREIIDHYYSKVKNPDNGKEVLQVASDIVGDSNLACPVIKFSEKFGRQNHTVYMMQFDYQAKFHEGLRPDWYRATHSDDVPFSLGSIFRAVTSRSLSDEVVADNMIRIISSFASKGIPITLERQAWPRVQEGGYYMNIEAFGHSELKRNLKSEDCALWNSLT